MIILTTSAILTPKGKRQIRDVTPLQKQDQKGKVVLCPCFAAHSSRSRFPSVHGAPVHLGDPSLIGIADLAKPDYGDPVEVRPGEMPVFWACGVTPQSVIAEVRPPFCITHAPGSMLITDLKNARLAVI